MNRRLVSLAALSVALPVALAGACKGGQEAPPPAEQVAPEPSTYRALFAALPATVDVDPAKAELGNRLYHDGRLSGDGSTSCATCHDLSAGGDDGRPTSLGIRGSVGPINAPTTLNAEYNLAQFWDGRAADLKEQAAGPVTNVLEMGATWESVVASIQQTPGYVTAFAAVYPDEGITKDTITDAIAEFERTLVTRTRFDAWIEGDDGALTAEEVHGLERFVAVGCATCHNGINVGGASYQKMGAVHDYFALRGGEITEADLGRFNVTGDEADRHRFKVPTLRNVALTAPYFHDGSVETLEQAITIMGKVQLGRELDAADVAAIATFLGALTGELPADIALAPFPAAPADGSGTAEGSGAAPTGETAPL